MVRPGTVPGEVLARIMFCDRCEGDRRPRMFVCDFHAGWWDGFDFARETSRAPGEEEAP